MKRIGFIASKMAQGNIVLYNVYVILLSILFSTFIFLIAGSTVVFALTLLSYLGSEIMIMGSEKQWSSIMSICMAALTVVVSIVNLIAIGVNVKFKLSKKRR